jgi:hypothetical protein
LNPAAEVKMLLWDVSTMRQTYLVLVVFLQLLLANNPGTALAQNFNELNRQEQLQQLMPSPQVQTPNFNAGRSSQTNTARTTHAPHKARHKQHKGE